MHLRHHQLSWWRWSKTIQSFVRDQPNQLTRTNKQTKQKKRKGRKEDLVVRRSPSPSFSFVVWINICAFIRYSFFFIPFSLRGCWLLPVGKSFHIFLRVTSCSCRLPFLASPSKMIVLRAKVSYYLLLTFSTHTHTHTNIRQTYFISVRVCGWSFQGKKHFHAELLEYI